MPRKLVISALLLTALALVAWLLTPPRLVNSAAVPALPEDLDAYLLEREQSIAEEFPMTRASLSHHFNTLKQADLVRTERRGQHIVYSLNTSVLDDVAAILMDLLARNGKDDKE